MLSDLKYRLRALFRRSAMERDLEDELRFHLEREVEKHMRAGFTRSEAERRARIEFGGLEQIREETRAVRGVARLEALLQDVRYGWRGVKSRPGFAAAVVLTLGLGIGANTAMFGVLDRLLLRPPAFLSEPDDVHRVYWSYMWDGGVRMERNFAYTRYLDIERSVSSFDETAAFAYPRLAVGRGANSREMTVAAVSASFFDLFPAPAALGRFFTPEEDALPAGRNVAVLAHGFWQSAYGGRTSVLGEELYAGDVVYTIIGVAPKGFVGMPSSESPVVFVPITTYGHARRPEFAQNYNWSWLEILVRRRADVPVEAATADLGVAFAASWEAERQDYTSMSDAATARLSATLSPVHFARGPDAGPEGRIALWVMGVACIVLLIAAANVINLLLARALGRRREIALRLALGVSRPRLVQQLMIETLLLALLGGAAGLVIATWSGGVLRGFFLRAEDIGAVATDGRTLLFAGLLTLAVALLTGLAPALQALRADVAGTLKGARDGGYRAARIRAGLLLLQAALSVVLLVGAGLFVRSLLNVRSHDLGYDVAPVVLVNATVRGVPLSDDQRSTLADRMLEAAGTVPGVSSVSLRASVPFYSEEGRGAPVVAGRDSLNLLGRYTLQAGSPSYFETIGTDILRGRSFTRADGAASMPVMVISEGMAHAIWPGQNAIGRQLRLGNDSTAWTVIGIAENIDARDIGGDPEFWYYMPIEQHKAAFGGDVRPALLVRVAGEGRDYVAALRDRLQREMPGEAYVTVTPFAEIIQRQQRSWRVGATMFVSFAVLALVLAAIGLYSVIAYAVAQRTREIGVRIALGARTGRVMLMIAAQGLAFALSGIIVGGAAALFAGRWIEPLLFSASAVDPLVYASVAFLLLLISLAATLRPALRATRVSPTIALRSD
ncbi:MAG TPA: ADOP family duplicated permease [Longimicrobiales bacterium]|nr:ADOP family duplicated permease [Longimicrobiales bacterium]